MTALVLALLLAAPAEGHAAKKAAPVPASKPDAGTPPAEEHHQATETPDPPVLKVGDDAPLFTLPLHNPDEAGLRSLDLSSLVGDGAGDDTAAKALLISFFATWCKPCKKEMPFLQTLSTEYKDKGLRVVSIAIDKDEANWPTIKELATANKVTYPILKDRYNLAARRYLGDKTQLPSVFIIARDGTVALVKQGYPNDAAEFLRAEVEKALAPSKATDAPK